LPGYSPTPLVDAAVLARELGVGAVLVKDESDRFGLPSFKILGTSWACYRALVTRLGRPPGPWSTLEDLAGEFRELRPLCLVTATDGNHGRAVAWMAARLGLEARIYVPEGTAEARVEAIEDEGGAVTVVEGSYDDAVKRAAAEVSDRCMVVSDTSWPAYEQIPRWVIEGYTTIFWELEDAIAAAGRRGLDVLVVPIGVGALASAAVLWVEAATSGRPIVVGVEPAAVPSMTRSVEAGHRVTIPGPHRTIMSGLRCGTPSLVAYPIVEAGVEWFVTISDESAVAAMRALAEIGVTSGETGAVATAGLAEVLTHPDAAALRDSLAPLAELTIVVLSTEGATDPASYQAYVGGQREDR
jgi:diaminopropionate ammonia-lyase